MFCINRFRVECLERRNVCALPRHSAASQHKSWSIYKKFVFANCELSASVMKMTFLFSRRLCMTNINRNLFVLTTIAELQHRYFYLIIPTMRSS